MTSKLNVGYQQAILARDIIDMARAYSSDPDALEYISRICFTLSMIYEEDHTINWHELFSVYDQMYYRLIKDNNPNQEAHSIELIRSKAIEIINT